jgi:uncharacterized protein YjiS (DUF1127 family)
MKGNMTMANIDTFGRRVRRWRQYRNTVRELTALSRRALDDLGISRFDIHRLAWQAAKLS